MTEIRNVFLSCVSKDLAQHRVTLKAQFAEAGINLVVQEDFAAAGSPYGTLLKIFAQIQQCDMVVQLLGSYQSHSVPAVVCEEVLTARPDFRGAAPLDRFSGFDFWTSAPRSLVGN